MNKKTVSKKSDAYHHGDLKNALLDETLRMVEEEGIEHISIREVTRRVGTSPSAIYRHFPSKEALMQAVVLAGFEKLDAALRPVLDRRDLSVIERFRLMARRYVDFARSRPALYRMLFGERAMEARESVHDIRNENLPTGFHALKALVDEAQKEGLLKKEDALLQSTMIWSTIHGLTSLLIDGHLHVRENFDAIFELGFKTLLEGLSTTSAKVQKMLGMI